MMYGFSFHCGGGLRALSLVFSQRYVLRCLFWAYFDRPERSDDPIF